MKKQKIPKAVFPENAVVEQKSRLLVEKGAKIAIDTVNWSAFPKRMPVWVYVAHDNQSIFLLYKVEGEKLRAVNTEDFGSVWEDSCVEFFVQHPGNTQYQNFECNALGALLVSNRTSREDAQALPPEKMASVLRQSSISHYYENGHQLTNWSLFLEIPKTIIGFSQSGSLSGKMLKANFYKCGDKTPEPHFISWSPIETANPDFHQPQFFGEIEFE